VIIVAYQDPHVNGLRMIHPEAVEKVDFDKVFNDDYWHFVPNDQFHVCELPRFETVTSDDDFFIGIRREIRKGNIAAWPCGSSASVCDSSQSGFRSEIKREYSWTKVQAHSR
jgi:hypothetical protein